MGDEVDPNWLPPQPESEYKGRDGPSPRPMPSNEVNPNWPPPVNVSSVRLPCSRRGGRNTRWLMTLAATAGIGLGVIITLLIVIWGRSNHPATPITQSAMPTAAMVPKPSAIPGPLPSAAPPSMSAIPPDAVELPANPLGYVQIGTQSGHTWCDVMQDWVACETSAANWPMINGERAHDVKVTASGDFNWVVGNLGRMTYKVTLGYQNYHALGWTISAMKDGTTFTNDRTGHGMNVNVENVSSF